MSRALEEQRDFLLDALRTLEADHDAGLVDDEEYAGLRDDYTVRAANVLRNLEAEQVGDGHRAAASKRSTGTTIAIVGAVCITFLVALLVLTRASDPRGEGESLTGGDDVAMPTASVDPRVAQLLTQAQQLFSTQEYAGSIKLYDQVLAIDPDQVEALTYRGWLLRLVSVQATGEDRTLLQSRARESLDRAVQLEPSYADARVFRAILLRDLGETEAALADLDALPADGIPAFMQQMVDGVRADLEGTPGSTAQPTSTVGTPR